jgi:hypothetical protein
MSAVRLGYLALLLCSSFPITAEGGDAPNAETILERLKGKISWDELLTDHAPGSISASSMLGISGDSISTVENVRDVVVSLKGLSSNEGKATLGISVTPARSSLAPMDLSTYASGPHWRLLGATTAGYAQGDTTIEGKQFERRAVSIETSLFWREKDDPVLAYAFGIRDQTGPCAGIFKPAEPAGGTASALKPAAPAGPPGRGAQSEDAARPPSVVTGPEADEVRKRAAACKDSVIKALRWNRSQSFASLATGWIKPTDGLPQQESLGRTAVVGLTYGFDGVDLMGLKDRAALAVSFRRTWDEPVLSSLVTGPAQEKDSSLLVARLTGGSDRFRALIEGSNAKAREGTTPSQRAFKAAIGVDVKLPYEGLWVSLRVGKQETVTGDDTEVGSFLNISYSPTALLSGR